MKTADMAAEGCPTAEVPVACVMEALLMPAGAPAGNHRTQTGADSIGKGVIYLYLNSEDERHRLLSYKQVPRTAAGISDMGALRLTLTETSVLERLTDGKSNKAIADDLFVSVNTVKTHVRSIFQKLNVNCRSAAVRRALDMGLAGRTK